MSNLEKFSAPQGGRVIVLSIKPKYADLILSGEKTVELRRSWAAENVDLIVIYASAPIQKFVGVVSVSEVVRTKPAKLWNYCVAHGGALSRRELNDYMNGKDEGFAVLLEKVWRFDFGIAPKKAISTFSPPQSFRYISVAELRKIRQLAERSGKKK